MSTTALVIASGLSWAWIPVAWVCGGLVAVCFEPGLLRSPDLRLLACCIFWGEGLAWFSLPFLCCAVWYLWQRILGRKKTLEPENLPGECVWNQTHGTRSCECIGDSRE